jgi:hypothetical protein
VAEPHLTIERQLRVVQDIARRVADRQGWRWDKDGEHPVFAALAAEALSILAWNNVYPTQRQRRTIESIARGELETLVDVIELILSGRSGRG